MAIIGVRSGVDAKFVLHDHPVHNDDRRILHGAVSAASIGDTDELVVLGRHLGEEAATIVDANYTETVLSP